jgi:hypothetical protein
MYFGASCHLDTLCAHTQTANNNTPLTFNERFIDEFLATGYGMVE